MTKGEIIGQVLLKISGGRASTDMAVRWDDIASYLAPAVNYIQTKQYYIEKREEGNDRGVNELMLQVFEDVPVEASSSRRRSYSDLPERPLTLPKGRSISYVGTMKGTRFLPMEHGGDAMQCYYSCFKKNVTSYSVEGAKIWYWNLPEALDKVLIKMIVDASQLKDDDEVVLPSGTEPELIELMVAFFTGQREMPSDPINDGQDLNATTE